MRAARDPVFFFEYLPRHDIVPLFVCGLILDVLGSYVYQQLGIGSPLWFSSAGTIFVAIMLGPWWGATCGLIANFIIGSFEPTFLKYGAVAVQNALLWGYLVRSAVRPGVTQKVTGSLPLPASTIALGVAAISALAAINTATVKTYLYMATGGMERSIAQAAQQLYGIVGRLEVESWAMTYLYYFPGEWMRYLLDTAGVAVVAFVVVAALRPLSFQAQLGRERPGQLLVSRGSIGCFIVVWITYVVAHYIVWQQNPEVLPVAYPSTRLFLASFLASPLFLGLIVMIYGVYCDHDGSIDVVRRFKAAREEVYSKIEALRRRQQEQAEMNVPGPGQNVGVDARSRVGRFLNEANALVGVVVMLLGWRQLLERQQPGLSIVDAARFVYVALLVTFVLLYFYRKLQTARRMDVGMRLLGALFEGHESDRAGESARREALGMTVISALPETTHSRSCQVVDLAEESAAIAISEWAVDGGSPEYRLVRVLRVYELDRNNADKILESAAVDVTRDNIEGVVLVSWESLTPDLLGAVNKMAGKTEKLVSLLGREELEEIVFRRIARLPAVEVLQRGWTLARESPRWDQNA